MKIFECDNLTIQEVEDLGVTINIKLSHNSLVNCYAPKLEDYCKEKPAMDFKEYFTILSNIANEYSCYFDLEYRIADKGNKIRSIVNGIDTYKNDLSSEFLNQSVSIRRLKSFFLCEEEDSLSSFAEKVVNFNKSTDMILDLLGKLLVDLLELDK